MKAKQTNILIAIMAVVVILAGGAYFVNTGALASFGLQPFSTAGAPPAAGVTVNVPAGNQGANYQPVLTTTLVDFAQPLVAVATAYDVQYDITNLQGVTRHVTAGTGTNVNVDIGEKYVATLKPNTVYYAASYSGTIANPTTVLSMPAKYKNTATMFIENDSIVGGRNGELASGLNTPDTATAGGTLNLKAHLVGVTVNRIFGDTAVAMSVDYNSLQYKTVTFGQVTCPDGTVVTPEIIPTPGANVLVGQAKTNKAAKIGCQLLGSSSISVPVNIEMQASFVGSDSNATIKAYDWATFTNTTTGAFFQGIENDASADTNSATNPTAVSYYTN